MNILRNNPVIEADMLGRRESKLGNWMNRPLGRAGLLGSSKSAKPLLMATGRFRESAPVSQQKIGGNIIGVSAAARKIGTPAKLKIGGIIGRLRGMQ